MIIVGIVSSHIYLNERSAAKTTDIMLAFAALVGEDMINSRAVTHGHSNWKYTGAQ